MSSTGMISFQARPRRLEPPEGADSEAWRMDPPTLSSRVNLSLASPASNDEPVIELSDRQKDILARRKMQGTSVAASSGPLRADGRKADPPSIPQPQQQQPFVTRSNVAFSPSSHNLRTPNPVSRDSMSSTSASTAPLLVPSGGSAHPLLQDPDQRALVRKYLEKAASESQARSSDYPSTSSKSNDLLRTVLQKVTKNRSFERNSSNTKDTGGNRRRDRLQRNPMAAAFTDRLRRATTATPDTAKRPKNGSLPPQAAAVLPVQPPRPMVESAPPENRATNSEGEKKSQAVTATAKMGVRQRYENIRNNHALALQQAVTAKKQQETRGGGEKAQISESVPRDETTEIYYDDDEEEEDDKSFREFQEKLQAEVMGQHCHLWRSFSALFRGKKMLNHQSFLAVDKVPVRFDRQTKEALARMHQYIKDTTVVEYVGKTQLVNDKKYANEVNNNPTAASLTSLEAQPERIILLKPKPVPAHATQPSRSFDPVMDARISQSVSSSSSIEESTRLSAKDVQDAILQTRSSDTSGSGQVSRGKDNRQSTLNSLVSNKPSTINLTRATNLPALRDFLSSSGEDDAEHNKAADETSPSSGVTITESPSGYSVTGLVDFETRSDPGLEVTLGEFKRVVPSSKVHSEPSSKGSSTSGSVPWASVDLRSVSSLDTQENVSLVEQDTPPAWAKVRNNLRKVDSSLEEQSTHDSYNEIEEATTEGKEETATYSTTTVGDDETVSDATLSILACSTATTSACLSTASSGLESDAISSFALDSSVEKSVVGKGDIAEGSPLQTTKPIGDKACITTKKSTGDSSNNSAVTKSDNSSKRKLDEAVVVRLRPQSESEVNKEARVVVGKKMIMLVESQSGDDQAVVVWRLLRTQIKSLTLDLETQQVTLVMASDNALAKLLNFSDSDDCLKFANAFYEMSKVVSSEKQTTTAATDSADRDIIGEKIATALLHEETEQEKVALSSYEKPTTSTQLSIFNEQAPIRLEPLNDEEQNVLETYRRLRKTRPAEDALHESVSIEGSVNQELVQIANLTADNDQIANKYRMMLKLGVPPDEVRQRMSSDGVHERISAKLITDVENMPPQYVSARALPSSPVSTFSSSEALSVTDIEVIESYRKMLRLKIPADAVRHKMTKDGVESKIIELVLGDEYSNDHDKDTEKVKNAAAPYIKMLKMSIPEEAVRHKMRRDGASDEVVRAVFGNSDSSDGGIDLTEEENAVAEPYRKMLSIQIPPDAVRHKMLKDQVGEKIIFAVLGGKNEKPKSKGNQLDQPTLAPEEESVASQYQKMLKLQVPKHVVVTKMKKEGVNEKIIAFVVGEAGSSSNPDSDAKDHVSIGSKLVSLHWTPLSEKEIDNSIWRASKKRRVAASAPARSDISKLIELFQKKTSVVGIKEKKDDDSNATGKAKLLDLTRSNNIAISLKAFKEFTYKDLADMIRYLDPERKIRGERVLFIRDLLPTTAEVKAVADFKGHDDRLVPSERWFRHIIDIKRIEDKVQVMRTMESFNAEATALITSFRLLADVCHHVMDSEKLQDLLEMVLRIGNIMNEGTRTGGAAGFKFDSLLRLTQTKSSDGKTTVLDYLVTVFVEKGQRATLDLLSDIPDCQAASRMLITDLTNEVKTLQASLQQCKTELQKLCDEYDRPTAKNILAANAGKASVTDARAELLSSLIARVGTADGGQTKSVETLSLSNIFRKKEQEESNCSLSLAGGIGRLKEFLDSEERTMIELTQYRDQALQACRDLAQYCGEGEGTGSTTSLLAILYEFATNLESALKKYDDLKVAAVRKLKLKEGSQGASASSDETVENSKSLVLLVNALLKDANERTKDDFRKGRVYEKPSSRLKAIYDREQRLGNNAPSTGKRKDLVATISEREGKVDGEDIQRVKAQFASNSCLFEKLVGGDSPGASPISKPTDKLKVPQDPGGVAKPVEREANPDDRGSSSFKQNDAIATSTTERAAVADVLESAPTTSSEVTAFEVNIEKQTLPSTGQGDPKKVQKTEVTPDCNTAKKDEKSDSEEVDFFDVSGSAARLRAIRTSKSSNGAGNSPVDKQFNLTAAVAPVQSIDDGKLRSPALAEGLIQAEKSQSPPPRARSILEQARLKRAEKQSTSTLAEVQLLTQKTLGETSISGAPTLSLPPIDRVETIKPESSVLKMARQRRDIKVSSRNTYHAQTSKVSPVDPMQASLKAVVLPISPSQDNPSDVADSGETSKPMSSLARKAKELRDGRRSSN